MKSFIRFLCGLITVLLLFTCFQTEVYAKKDVIIVIDPGHGGSNMGAQYNNTIEKEATLKVAAAMKAELEKYDGVVVYVTRTSDEDMELIERAQFAKNVNADILLSLHFNMSENHDLHGSEMWISSQAGLKEEAERFSQIELKLLADHGIETRGCFTRLNDAGTDYYGVIRESAKFHIPAVIVEHCYFDRAEEEMFYETDEALEQLGRIDATAVAMSYGLTSEALNVDYSKHRVNDTVLPERIYSKDTTAPSEAQISIVSFDPATYELTLNLKAKEEESSLVYYEYSFNGGNSFFPRQQIGIRDDFNIIVYAYPMGSSDLTVRVSNAYGLYTDSNVLNIDELIFEQYWKTDEQAQLMISAKEDAIQNNELLPDFSVEVQDAASVTLMAGGLLGGAFVVLMILFDKNILTFKKRRVKEQET